MADRRGRNLVANLADDLVVLRPVIAGGATKTMVQGFHPADRLRADRAVSGSHGLSVGTGDSARALQMR
jgi:hypothetical protein